MFNNSIQFASSGGNRTKDDRMEFCGRYFCPLTPHTRIRVCVYTILFWCSSCSPRTTQRMQFRLRACHERCVRGKSRVAVTRPIGYAKKTGISLKIRKRGKEDKRIRQTRISRFRNASHAPVCPGDRYGGNYDLSKVEKKFEEMRNVHRREYHGRLFLSV